ncbi:CPBP family intramembrane metalloprotease [Candidatus Saccharibacteria bacterium]|nr:CPBP family intramembrane metalloprotease [Candidatus Saccharibacteria bacterium]
MKKLVLFTLTLSAFVFAIVVGVQILLGIIVTSLFPVDVVELPIVNALFSIVSYALAMILIILLPPILLKNKIKKSSRDSLGLRGLPTWTDLGLAPIGYIASIILAAGITAIFNLFPWFNASEAQELGFSHYMMGGERVIAFLLLAVIAPIAEEIIFRGWLYGKLRVKIPKWVAILVTSLVFGLVHMQWNVGVTVFAMSVITCSMREITGTIYAGTLVHIINNSVAFYLVYVIGMS